jgi:Ca2+-binding EF-hand superfamily protein
MAVDFETFSKILNRPGGFRDPGEPEEYCRGFQVFDKDMTGFIGVGQLRYILTNLGEKMSDDEVDELLKAVETSPNGDVNYTGMSTLKPPHAAAAAAARGGHKKSEGKQC